MIFQHTADMILAGRKTQTLRLVKDDEVLRSGRVGFGVYFGRRDRDRPKWIVGRTYAVQRGRGMPEIARIRVTHILPVADVTSEADDQVARLEGFGNLEAFLLAWRHLHGRKASRPAWAVQFKRIDGR